MQSLNSMRGDLDDGYDCPQCLNRGFIYVGHNGVRLCDCKPIRDGLSRLKRQGLLHASKRCTFASFRADAPWQRMLLERAQAFAALESPGWLFIGGQSGCGKTHLCTAAAVALLYRGLSLRYMRWMNDSAQIKSLGADSARSALLQGFIDAPLLYIDDLFKTPPTEADVRIAFEILNERYNNPEKITIISSERTLPEITRIDEAVGGRIFERCGADFQLNVARAPERNFRFQDVPQI